MKLSTCTFRDEQWSFLKKMKVAVKSLVAMALRQKCSAPRLGGGTPTEGSLACVHAGPVTDLVRGSETLFLTLALSF